MFKPIDKVIDNLSMYRLVVYVLLAFLASAALLGLGGSIKYSAVDIVVSACITVTACWVINRILADFIFRVPQNGESAIITGLILALIVPPMPQGYNLLFLLAASGLAMGSKYVLSIRGKHLFNPAAVAVVLTALGPQQSANWWVGTAVMAPVVFVGGFLIMRKIRREAMVGTFFTVAIVATIGFGLASGDVATPLKNLFLSSPALFLGFIMLTEPMTSPNRQSMQIAYAALVGFLFLPQVHFGGWYTTPEIALLIGNVFAYLVSPKFKLHPTFKEKLKVATNTFDFVFAPGQKFAYEPGQYMEWTVPHSKKDSRGVRRFLTIASSPTEPDLRIGVKFYTNGSTYKKSLISMGAGTQVAASQVSGDFTMPKDTRTKLAFIAGGIGITPFRSMTKYMLDMGQKRDVVMLYGARSAQDVAYHGIFEQARRGIGMRTTYLFSDEQPGANNPYVLQGVADANVIRSQIPDYADRTFYISGTHAMVESVSGALHQLGLHRRQIKTDFFPGYV